MRGARVDAMRRVVLRPSEATCLRPRPPACRAAAPAVSLVGVRAASSSAAWVDPPPAAARAIGGAHGRRYTSISEGDGFEYVVPEGVEFSFLPYCDIRDLGFDRAKDFCMLALRHPTFAMPEDQRLRVYDLKREDREARVDLIFKKCDTDNTGSLDPQQLCKAMNMIGMPAHEALAHGLIYRHGRKGDGRIHAEEFSNVVAEVWGRVPEAHFCDSLTKVDPSLSGAHHVSFVGRQSPAAWVLRLVRNSWPVALKQVALMRNLEDNPEFDPFKAEVLIDTYEGQTQEGLDTTVQVAAMALEQPPSAKGGIIVRCKATPQGIERWPDGGRMTIVPFRGVAENSPGGLLHQAACLSTWLGFAGR